MDVNARLLKVREEMNILGLDAFVVLTQDPHGSEYPADHWKFREYLSGFNGSAGTLVITHQYVGLWVDSRYYIQAEKQVRGTCIEVFKMGMPQVPSYVSWLTYILPSGSMVGVDGFTLPYADYCQMAKEFSKFGIGINYKVDIINELFALREPMPMTEVEEVEEEFVSKGRLEKIARVRSYMQRNNMTHYLISALDDIAYLLNMRGQDVAYNPVFYAYMIITLNEAHLYIDPHKLTAQVSRALERDGIRVSLYDHYEKNLSNLPETAHIGFNPAKANTRNIKALPKSAIKMEEISVVERMKACKSDAELNMIRDAHRRDGVAMVKFLYWLDKEISEGRTTSELEVSAKLLELRQKVRDFRGESFETIAGYAENGAIVHYAPCIETNRDIDGSAKFLLVDSGGQYNDGTTDLTRTIAIGSAEEWASESHSMERSDYTLVLKGHLTLARAVFPQGTSGIQLDTYARIHLWKNGLDFGHGSGHGVGMNLNVHEGPIFLSKKYQPVSMQEGMVVSNEPGLYREGKYGIRIENLMVCERARTDKEFGTFYRFGVLTLCPYERKAIDVDLLTDNEIAWINNYHRTVYDMLHSSLTEEEEAWLKEATREIGR